MAMTKQEAREIIAKAREKVLKRMEEVGECGQWIGFASPTIIKGLVERLRKDPSGWWATAPQLYSERFITENEAQVVSLEY